jgi:3-phosphoglycerate kinase
LRVVFEAFAQAHRVHSSTTGILQERPAVAGFLMERELQAYEKVLSDAEKPIVAVIGGAKLSDKMSAVKNLLGSVDNVLIGGALANVFLAAHEKPLGDSLVESYFVDKAKKEKVKPEDIARSLIESGSTKLMLPTDLVAGQKQGNKFESKVVDITSSYKLEKPWAFYDIGPGTIKVFSDIIKKTKVVVWSGPMGLFEEPEFEKGTKEIAQTIADSSCYSIIAGGDTQSVVVRYGLAGKFSHISTGGGASLEVLAGNELPVMKYLYK